LDRPLQAGTIGQSMGLPAGTAYNNLSLGELRDVRGNYFTDRAVLHHIADAKRYRRPGSSSKYT
jgi:hypothetical protein